MKIKQLPALCLAASALTTAPAMAWESADGQFSTSASVALSTDYMWRGASQTDNEAAISGSFDVGHASGLYIGTWASNVNFEQALTNSDGDEVKATSAHIEIDVYGGFASEYAGVGYDIGFMRYFYPGTDRGGDWNEAYLGLSYSYFSFKVSHSTDAIASGETGTHYLFGFNYGLPMDIELHANYAIYDLDDYISDLNKENPTWNLDDTLEDWNIGLSKEIAGFGFDLTYYNTLSDAEDYTERTYGSDSIADDRIVFTISKSL